MLASLLALALALSDPPTLTPESFASYARRLEPGPTETWQRIPWRLDLLAARAEAVELDRPLFLWSMNGHPLGCT